jgi:hypothetical protein
MAAELIKLIKKESCPCCLAKFSKLEKWVLYTCCCRAVCSDCYNQIVDDKNDLSIKKCITCRRYPPELYVVHLSKNQTKLIQFDSVTINNRNNDKQKLK